MRIRITAVLAAIAAALGPLPRTLVERTYSTSLYLRLQHAITPFSNLFPFALFDVLIAAASLVCVLTVIRELRRRRFATLALRAAAWIAAFYLAFLLLWGLNYRRVPLLDKLQFDPASVSAVHALDLATTAAGQLNATHDPAHSLGWLPLGSIDPSLAQAYDRTQSDLGVADPAVPARPKTTLLNPFFQAAGVEGMTDPYFLETLIQSEILPFERPMDIAHEWGHLAGYADESEASFTGWLTCLHGSAADQYSGWLFLFGELLPDVAPQDRRAVISRLAPGPLADLRAIDQRRLAQVNRTVSRTSGRVYDGYLKANRIPSGLANYDEVVRLALGVKFGADWTPLRVGASPRQ